MVACTARGESKEEEKAGNRKILSSHVLCADGVCDINHSPYTQHSLDANANGGGVPTPSPRVEVQVQVQHSDYPEETGWTLRDSTVT
jgi:hypothetical protein